MSIAHIVHPVEVTPTSDLVIAQPITFETMDNARAFARDSLSVECYAVQYADEERIPLPESFVRTRDLNRCIADVYCFQKRRKLAILKDILDILYESSTADYFIYTNVDIAVQTYFYSVVADIIQEGYDSFIINRRTIPDSYRSLAEIPLMLSQLGTAHPGWDCFVFPRQMYPKFRLRTACIGTDWIGRMMIANMATLATRFNVFKDLHMTFHLGDEQTWKNDDFADYVVHNREECHQTLLELNKEYGPFPVKSLPAKFLRKLETGLDQPAVR